ncbi:hypothetical protein LT330_010581 [Penicillium expansum]|uniref:Uncharacterized protein n=1 Tax=Penicillium expansum TaxID=27334 RepID=A0A0A2KNY8_PENEN|nr:hypothetical protein PEX2_055600 [Penicillium expansum]KAK4863066.1 hypothetical protein LT330_010581 [Penicillium expansum]KGO59587.1 hypothetical protein PEX2_055600 [Penicillium expansum]KGO66060.1 hypothetical protein PEX1_047070 [Penicillium expansum]
MESADFDEFIRWGEDCDEFPDLQYALGSEDISSWDQILDQYLDPYEYLDPFPLGALAPIEEKAEAIEALPELSPSPTPQYDIQMLSESITELKHRVNGLEDRITEKQRRIADLEAYLENLQPFLLQLGTSIEGLLTSAPQ